MNIITQIQEWHYYTTILIVMYEGNTIIGSVRVSNYEDETWIHSLYVEPSHRKLGVANKLLCEADKYAEHDTIVNLEDNSASWIRDYYIKRGYNISKNS